MHWPKKLTPKRAQKRLVPTFVLVVVLVLSSLSVLMPVFTHPSTPAHADTPVQIGGVSMGAYCQYLGKPAAVIDPSSPSGWECTVMEQDQINLDASCQFQYQRSDAVAVVSDPNDAYHWVCKDTKGNTLGGVNLTSFCKSLGYVGENPNPQKLSDWWCYKWTQITNVDMTAACQWQYNRTDTTALGGSNTNPNDWKCYVMQPSTPTPQQCGSVGGQWYVGGNTGLVYTKGQPRSITVRVWSDTGCAIQVVPFIVVWPNQTHHIVCMVYTPDPGTTDHYTCTTDLNSASGGYPPDGQVKVGFTPFDVQNHEGCPDTCYRSATFQSSVPTSQPTSRPIANGSVNACRDTNYGACRNYRNGDYGNLGDYANSISSFQVPSGCLVRLFLGPNLTGNPAVITGDYRDLSQLSRSPGLPNGYDNDIQSFHVEGCTGNPPMSGNPTPNPTSGTGSGQATPTLSSQGNIVPGGLWSSPTSAGTVYTQGNSYQLVAQAYPTRQGDPQISSVRFTAYWNGAWHTLCTVPFSQSSQSYYRCNTNFFVDGSYPPNGPLPLSFDVYDVAGNSNLSPNGIHIGYCSDLG